MSSIHPKFHPLFTFEHLSLHILTFCAETTIVNNIWGILSTISGAYCRQWRAICGTTGICDAIVFNKFRFSIQNIQQTRSVNQQGHPHDEGLIPATQDPLTLILMLGVNYLDKKAFTTFSMAASNGSLITEGPWANTRTPDLNSRWPSPIP